MYLYLFPAAIFLKSINLLPIFRRSRIVKLWKQNKQEILSACHDSAMRWQLAGACHDSAMRWQLPTMAATWGGRCLPWQRYMRWQLPAMTATWGACQDSAMRWQVPAMTAPWSGSSLPWQRPAAEGAYQDSAMRWQVNARRHLSETVDCSYPEVNRQ